MYRATHAVWHTLLGAHACRLLIGAWNPMLCPIWGFSYEDESYTRLQVCAPTASLLFFPTVQPENVSRDHELSISFGLGGLVVKLSYSHLGDPRFGWCPVRLCYTPESCKQLVRQPPAWNRSVSSGDASTALPVYPSLRCPPPPHHLCVLPPL